MNMKRTIYAAIISAALLSCNGQGTEQREMPAISQEPPTSNPNPNTSTPYDTSTEGVQDSTTTMGYDTSSKREN